MPRFRAIALAVAIGASCWSLWACAAGGSPGDTPGAAPVAQPTDADKKLADRFLELKAKLDGGKGTEVINLTRDDSKEAQSWIGFTPDNTGAMALERLQNRRAATDSQLAAARGSYTRIVGMLENAAKLPAFEPYVIARRPKDQPIVIDGTPDEPAWKAGHAVELRYQFPRFERVATPVASSRLLWDETNLYAAFDVPDPDILTNDKGPKVERFLNDCVELFLLPETRFPVYWELNVSATNGIVDRTIYKFPRAWNGHANFDEHLEGMKTATKRTTDKDGKTTGYTVEISIPWTQLPGMKRGPVAGDHMHGLMAYSDVRGKLDYANQKYFSEVPTVAGFQDIWSFRVWKFGEK